MPDYGHSGTDAFLTYRCGGSTGLVVHLYDVAYDAPVSQFHPVKGTQTNSASKSRVRAGVNRDSS